MFLFDFCYSVSNANLSFFDQCKAMCTTYFACFAMLTAPMELQLHASTLALTGGEGNMCMAEVAFIYIQLCIPIHELF